MLSAFLTTSIPSIFMICVIEGRAGRLGQEIPMLAMPDDEALMQNACRQLTELILQNLHHPSICFWGLQNEIAITGEILSMYRGVERLQTLAHKLDPNRLTTSSDPYCVKNNSPLNHITDVVAYNVYFGWYYGQMEEYANFLDSFHADNPDVPLGISEYGVDARAPLSIPMRPT